MPELLQQKLPFVKYSLNGNSFVILDLTHDEEMPEEAFACFAQKATDPNRGIGSDNLIVLQSNTPEVVAAINRWKGCWDHLPDHREAGYIFRMFEPDGREALCCGNALMCIAHLLYQKYEENPVKIVTEIPLRNQQVLTIGLNATTRSSWVVFDEPRTIPGQLCKGTNLTKVSDAIRHIHLTIAFFYRDRSHVMDLPAYLVFTGEPHLVVYTDELSFSEGPFSTSTLSECLFSPRDEETLMLVSRIGRAINERYRDDFPEGINVNFALTRYQENAMEYRCYERGVYKETLACGTGALAVAYVSKVRFPQLNDLITVIPYHSRQEGMSGIRIECLRKEWLLQGFPELIFEGMYHLK